MLSPAPWPNCRKEQLFPKQLFSPWAMASNGDFCGESLGPSPRRPSGSLHPRSPKGPPNRSVACKPSRSPPRPLRPGPGFSEGLGPLGGPLSCFNVWTPQNHKEPQTKTHPDHRGSPWASVCKWQPNFNADAKNRPGKRGRPQSLKSGPIQAPWQYSICKLPRNLEGCLIK